jgi:hypothetical protein
MRGASPSTKRRGRAPVAAGGDITPGGRAGSPAGMRSSPPPATRAAGAAAHAAGGAGGAMPTPRRGHAHVELLAEQPLSARWRSFKTRTLSTLALLAGFVAILYAGHVVVCVFIMCIQARASAWACGKSGGRARAAHTQRARSRAAAHAPLNSAPQLRGTGGRMAAGHASAGKPHRARGTCRNNHACHGSGVSRLSCPRALPRPHAAARARTHGTRSRW